MAADDTDLGPGHHTIEEAALDGYPAAAHARVVQVVCNAPTTAQLLVDTELSHPMLVVVNRDPRGRWHFGSDGNI